MKNDYYMNDYCRDCIFVDTCRVCDMYEAAKCGCEYRDMIGGDDDVSWASERPSYEAEWGQYVAAYL